MKRLALIIVLTLSTIFAAYGQTTPTNVLWYPGAAGSQWVYKIYYNMPAGDRVTARLTGTMQLDNRTYKVVEENQPLLAGLSCPKPSPYTTFREDAAGRVLGYGVAENRHIEEFFIKDFVDAGGPRDAVSMTWVYNEWVLLPESPRVGLTWIITQAQIRLRLPSGGVLSANLGYRGEIRRTERVTTPAGSFDAFVVNHYEFFEMAGDKEEDLMGTLWLAPNAGIVQVGAETIGLTVAELIEYNIVTPCDVVAELSSPAGGEVWSKTREIKWRAATTGTGCTIKTLALQYSTDSVTWKDIQFDGVNDGSFMWDTRTAPDGRYMIRVVAADGGKSKMATSQYFTIDNTPPTKVSGLASIEHTVMQWSSKGLIQVKWTAATDAGCGVDGYSIAWDEVAGTVPDTVKDMEESATQTASSDLGSGNKYYFHICAVDNVGNWGEAEHLGPFYIDKTPPGKVVDLASPSHTPGSFSSDDTVDVSWKPADDWGSGLDGYSVLWDTKPETLPDKTKNKEGTATGTSSQPLSENANHYFHIRAVDKAGNWSDAAAHIGPFYVDIIAPTLTLSSSSHKVDTWSNKRVVTVVMGAVDKFSGVKGYSVVWDGAATTEPETKENKPVSVTLNSPELKDGQWFFHARAMDKAGNWSKAFSLGPFKIDTDNIQPPTGLTSETHALKEWNKQNVVGVKWTSAVDDLSGLSGYVVVWDNKADTIPDAVKGKSLKADTVRDVSPVLPDGVNNWFHICALDEADNMSKPVHLGPFYIDANQPGLVTDLASSSHQVGKWSRDNVLKFAWKPAVDAGSGLDGYSAVIDNAVMNIPDPIKNLDNNITNLTSKSLSDGRYYLHIRSVDKMGIWSESAVHIGPFLIDTTPPSIPSDLKSTSHNIRVWSNRNTVNLTWQASSDTGSELLGYSASWDNLSVSSPDDSVDLDSVSTSVVRQALQDGDKHNFHIKAVDKAGNWSDAANLGPFFIDTTPPASVKIFEITEDFGEQYTHIKNTTLYYSGIERSAFTVYVAGIDSVSGLKEAVFPDCVGPGKTVIDKSVDQNYSYSYQYEIAQGSTFDGKVDITLYDNAGNSRAVRLNIVYDNAGPDRPANVKCDGGKAWNNTGKVTVTWEGEGDSGSGVVDYYVEPDNNKPKTNPSGGSQTAMIAVDDKEAITFYVRGVDNVGNWGEPGSATIGVDTKAPGKIDVISHKDSDSNSGYDNDAQLEFDWPSATDNIKVDHYEVHLSVGGDDFKLLESTGNNSYVVSGKDGQSFSVKVAAVDIAGNKGALSAPSDKVVCDMTPPSLAVAMIPNPGFYNFMDIGLVSSEKLLEGSPSLSVNLGGETAVSLNKVAENIWVGNYTISVGAIGTATITVSGTDLAGNKKTDSSESFSAQTVLAKAPARIQSTDGKLALYIPPGTFQKDTVVTIITMALDARLAQNMENIEQLAPSLALPAAGIDELESVGAKYIVWSNGVSLLNKVALTIKYEANSGVDRNHLGVYRWNGEVAKWEYVGGSVDEETGNIGSISISVETFGSFGLYADIKPPKISRISPSNGSVLDNSLPEFSAKVDDGGSGVDFPSLSLFINGQKASADKSDKNGLVVFKLKHELTADKHRFFIAGKDRAGNPFTSDEYTIIIPVWATIPDSTELLQNYPNPFNPETWIPYRLSEPAKVELHIYNASGQLIRTLELGQQKPGSYTDKDRAIYWDGKNENGEAVSTGVYFYHLVAGKYISVRKMVIIR